jgi:hypothetical protein
MQMESIIFVNKRNLFVSLVVTTCTTGNLLPLLKLYVLSLRSRALSSAHKGLKHTTKTDTGVARHSFLISALRGK